MDRENLKNALCSFLSSGPDQKVLLIKGDWGVGKSYFIEKTIREWAKNREDAIAITSLFGITDFNQSIDRLHYLNQDKKSAAKNIFHWVNKARKMVPSSIPSGIGVNINLDSIFQTIVSFLLKDGILIIDDVERKNPDLKLEKVLGTASYLSEKVLKKAIIVFSEKNLSGPDKIALDDLREKVLDAEYFFSPSAEENAKIILADSERVEIIKKLQITNIRIIKKISYAWSELADKFTFKYDFIKSDVLNTIGVLCLVHYSDRFPFGLESIPKQLDWLTDKEDSEEKANAKRLEQLGYYFDEREYPIFDFLKLGMVDKEKWQASIISFESHHQSEELKKALSKQWRVFNGNFKSNFSNVVEEMTTFLDQNAQKLHPRQVLEILRLFDNIGHDYSRSIWLSESVKNNLDSIGSDEVHLIKAKLTEPEILKLLAEKERSRQHKATLEDSIKKVVYKGGWSEEDTQVIQNSTVEDYKSWLLNSEYENLLPLIRGAHEMMSQWDPGYKKAAENLYAAAQLLASDPEISEGDKKLNAERVKTFLKKH